jgi:phospholipase/carboxylesterase
MAQDPTLHARPSAVEKVGPSGLQKLNIGSRRDSYFYVRPHADSALPMPLVLLLHGAGGHAHHGLGLLEHLADDNRMILAAPASTASTWDVIAKRTYGPDVALLNETLKYMFENYPVDPSHLAIGGFSDGASYALTVGLANGDLFTHVIAFSPGFIAPMSPRGEPGIFVSHGTRDIVLPIGPCSRSIVSQLRQAEYSVMYDEFDDGHAIPEEVAAFAVNWFMDRV